MTILIVDDDSAITRMLSQAFAKAGYRVSTAENGAEAIGKMGSGSFDVLLCDLQMPVMDGYELVAWTETQCPATRILLMTGYTSKEVPGDYPLLRKPFTPSSVVAAVGQLLRPGA